MRAVERPPPVKTLDAVLQVLTPMLCPEWQDLMVGFEKTVDRPGKGLEFHLRRPEQQ